MRVCLNCTFRIADDDVRVCPKCDAELGAQTDGSVATVDIAHHQETSEEAMTKLRATVTEHRRQPTRQLRVIVGTGRIRDLAQSTLVTLQNQGLIRSAALENPHRGSILVRLKR